MSLIQGRLVLDGILPTLNAVSSDNALEGAPSGRELWSLGYLGDLPKDRREAGKQFAERARWIHYW